MTLTGHSLGRAAALLAAARLYDEGLPQVKVVTFGAPAVGNSAFNETYEPLLHVDRIVMAGDPVKGIFTDRRWDVQPIFQGNGVGQCAVQVQRFAHDIVGYADAAAPLLRCWGL